MKRKRVGQALVERKRISYEDSDKIAQEQQANTQRGFLGEILFQRELVAREGLVAALEEVTPYRFADPRFATVKKVVLELIPQEAAVRYCVLPLIREGNRIITVMAEPQNLQTIDDLRFMTGTDISPRLGFRSDILAPIENRYAKTGKHVQAEQANVPFIEQVDVSKMQFFTASSGEKSKAAIEEELSALQGVLRIAPKVPQNCLRSQC
jgi:type IV pilus assembly protein PilB